MKVQLPTLEKPLTEVPETSFTLPSSWYLDQPVFELEKQNIFYKTWQYVAHESMLPEPGDYQTLEICDESIFVIRGTDGELRGFFNVCRHRAHELLTGQGNVENAIVCPYHAWSYHLEGGLMGARMSNHRPGFDRSEFGLRSIRLELFAGFIFVNLDEGAESLQSLAGDLLQDITQRVTYLDSLKLAGTDVLGETHLQAGWKVVVDNYVECYHCIPAHPDFASIINMKSYQMDTFKYWSRQLGEDIRLQNSAYPVDPDVGVQTSMFWYLWPNTTFNVMPGSNEFSVYSVQPDGIDGCHFGGHVFTSDGKINQVRAQYVIDVLTPEDIALCESVQRGLKSKSYDQGPFIVDNKRSGTAEHALHHFHRLVQQSLEA